MKIAIFTDTFIPDVNGVAKTLGRFTDYLKENQVEYRVFAPKATKENQFSNQIHYFNSLPFLLYPECRLALPNLPQIKEELSEFKPDLIHVATPFNMGLTGLHFAKKLRIPVVGSYHTDFDKYLEHYNLQFLMEVLWKYLGWFHRPLEKIFVPSHDTKERLEKRGFTNLSIWPRGIDRTLFHSHYDVDEMRRKYHVEGKHVLLYVGRIAGEKDVMLLPEIAKQLPEEMQRKVHWLVVGDGPMKEDLKKAAPDNMTLTGFLGGEELAKIYTLADLFVFPSASETFGNVVLEALACGTPVIGANAGGVRTIIQHGKTGMLSNPKDAISFAAEIMHTLTDPNLKMQMQIAGIRYAQAQSWDEIFSNLVAAYRETLIGHTYKEKVLA